MGDWIPELQQADKIKIDGQWTPGTCEFQGLSRVRDFEVIDAVGLSGATVRYRGWKLARFKILLHLYDPDDWADYYKIKPTLDKLPIAASLRP